MISHKSIKQALLIRRVEETFLDLFSQGKLNGTVHTCIGQEFSSVAFAGQLKKSDFIFSNHRCHGHYLAFTKDCFGLMAELLGKKTGTSGGVGSSQHLCHNNFYSNGVQGGITPVAAGFALSNKLLGNNNIGIVFIGDGTLGEGVLYETMNIISKWQIPLMIVCENNYYAQSTPQSVNLAGDILKRAEAFDIKTFKSDTWEVEGIIKNAEESINFVRESGKPAFHLVNTYRLKAHSKGDDDREPGEIQQYLEQDFLYRFKNEDPIIYEKYLEEVNEKIRVVLAQAEGDADLDLNEYFKPFEDRASDSWLDVESTNKRQVELINQFFSKKMGSDKKTIFLGEDVLSPYGGAFKVAKNLSVNYPGQVFSTPISEAALVGVANGLALAGFKPYAEIMFGDFMTLAMDQIINHASKFHHMYNGKATCPVVIRTPMGGNRGYGPTHSQTLDKFLVGIDNVTTVALNTLIDPGEIYEAVHQEKHPVIVIENKVDYGKRVGVLKVKNYKIQKNQEKYPVVKAYPVMAAPTATIVTYGANADWIINNLNTIFLETDFIPEVIVLAKIHPLNYTEIIKSVKNTRRLYVVEEGSSVNGIGSEIIAGVVEQINIPIFVKRVGALAVPIPAVKSLERAVLPRVESLIEAINTK